MDPVYFPVASLLEFLQDRFSACLFQSTFKVYVAAIAAFHVLLGGGSLGNHHLITCLLREDEAYGSG